MITEVFIEGNRLDVSGDLSTLVTFAIDDIKDFASRSTSWSKEITLPGTANNNKLFGHIFEIGQSNTYTSTLQNVGYNFNAAKSASCLIFQDSIQSFKGVLRMLQIVIDKGVIEYQVQVVGEIAGLNVALSSGRLEDLDFSAYDHTYNHTNIVNSWDNAGGSGYYYPLIDYGTYSTAKHDWDIQTFRPALYAKEYIDKMFAAANYRYDCTLFNTSRFKKLIVPGNTKILQQSNILSYSATRDTNYLAANSGDNLEYVVFEEEAGEGFLLNSSDTAMAWATPGPAPVKISGTFSGTYTSNIGPSVIDITIEYFNVGVTPPISTDLATVSINTNNGTDVPWSVSFSDVSGNMMGEGVEGILIKITKTGTGSTHQFYVGNAVVNIVTAVPVSQPIFPGATVQMSKVTPRNVRQIDFFKSIIQLFNLYVYEDRFDERLIHIAPYVDLFTGDSVDWSYKLDRNKPVIIKPMSELNARIYEFKYKSDSDYYNEMYRKRYSEGYGDRLYDSEFEFTAQKKSLELIFSGTPLVKYQDDDKYYSTILKQSNNVEETIDSNIRILQSKKITGVTSWKIRDNIANTDLTTITSYGYAGHFDDPATPSNDLNFGALKEIFATITGGDLSTTQFNVYWSPYMAEITNKDSKLITAHFYLTPADIQALDFSKYIYIDGVQFRLNKIIDYNMSRPDTCKCELLKVNYTQY